MKCYIQPGAKKTHCIGKHGDAIKIRLQAAAQQGKANIALCQFLAEILSVKITQLNLIKGEKNRHKIIQITCDEADYDTLQQRIAQLSHIP